MLLKPSEIFFTQDSIGNTFGRHNSHRNTNIGETLDSICDGRCSVRSIPAITVVKRDGKWFSVDNRRLWVFRHLERLGKCPEIEVIEGWSIPTRKFTTKNGGTSVTIYKGRRPGGSWYFKPTVYVPRPVTPKVDETRPSDSNASQVTQELKTVTQDPLVGEHESKTNTLKRKDESSPPTSTWKRMKILDSTIEQGTTSIGTNTTIKHITVSGGNDPNVKRNNGASSSILAVRTLAGQLLRRTNPFDQHVSRIDTFGQLVRRTNSVGHHVRFDHVVRRHRAVGTDPYEHIVKRCKLHEQQLKASETAIRREVGNKNNNYNDDSYDKESDFKNVGDYVYSYKDGYIYSYKDDYIYSYDDYVYSYEDYAGYDTHNEFYYDDGEGEDGGNFDNGNDSGNGDDSDDDDSDGDNDDDDDDDVDSDVNYDDGNDDNDCDYEDDVENDDDSELNNGDDNDIDFDDDEDNDDDSNGDADDDDSFYDEDDDVEEENFYYYEDTDDDYDDDNGVACCDDTVDASDDEKKDAATTDNSDNWNFESQNIVSRYVYHSEIRCSHSQQTNLDTKDAIVDDDEKKNDNAYNDKKIILIITKKKDATAYIDKKDDTHSYKKKDVTAAYDDNKDDTHTYKKKDATDDDDTCNKTDDTNNKKDDTHNYKKKDNTNNKKDATSDNDRTKKDEGNSNDNNKIHANYNDKVDDYVDNNDDDVDDDDSNNTQNDVNRGRRRATRFNFLMKAACHPYVNLQYEF